MARSSAQMTSPNSRAGLSLEQGLQVATPVHGRDGLEAGQPSWQRISSRSLRILGMSSAKRISAQELPEQVPLAVCTGIRSWTNRNQLWLLSWAAMCSNQGPACSLAKADGSLSICRMSHVTSSGHARPSRALAMSEARTLAPCWAMNWTRHCRRQPRYPQRECSRDGC